MRRFTRLLCGTALLVGSGGCRDVDRFDTRNGDMYCGSLVGYGDISTGFDQRWVGSEEHPTLSLTLTTGEMFKVGGIPAVIRSNDAAFGPCGPDRPLFDRADVRTIDKALGDRLSGIQLADDHVADLLTFVDSTCSGSMVAVLSLVQNGSVELRLLRPAPEPDADAGADAGATPDSTQRFGLFVLKKSKQGCPGF